MNQNLIEHETVHPLTKYESPLGRLLHYWNGNPKIRVAVGMCLLSWGMIATASWAMTAAGILLGTRSAVSALWAFTATKGILDVIRGRKNRNETEKDFQRMQHRGAETCSIVAAVTAWAVATILSFNGIDLPVSLAEADSLTPTPDSPTRFPCSEKCFPLPHTEASLPSVEEIAEDIRKDHPKQWWVSLEQMIRRVEGLRSGIPLDQSDRLVQMNSAVSRSVHDPAWVIASMLESHWFDISNWIDSVCRKLSEHDLVTLTREYIENTRVVDTIPIDWPGIQPVPDVTWHREIPPLSTLPNSIIPALTMTGVSLWVWVWVGLIGEKLLSQTESQGENTQRSPLHNRVESYGTSECKHTEEISSLKGEGTIPNESCGFELTGEGACAQKKIHTLFTKTYEWQHVPESETKRTNSLVEVYDWSTFGGSYRIFVEYWEKTVSFTLLWYDGGKPRKHFQGDAIPYTTPLSLSRDSKSFEAHVDTLLEAALEHREAVKVDEIRSIEWVLIPKLHLQNIYTRLEMPEVRDSNHETLGFWIASAYNIQDHTLRFGSLAIPELDEQESSPTWCRIKNLDLHTWYNFSAPNNFISRNFSNKESQIIIRKRNQILKEGAGVVYTGASCSLNWHKHPNGIVSPSQGDIAEAAKDIRLQYPGRTTYFYTIFTKMAPSRKKQGNKDKQVGLIRWTEYGWKNDYSFRTFLLTFEKGVYQWTRQLCIEIEP